MSDKFGSNKYGNGGNFVKRNRFKLQDGDNIFRILPAMGDLAEEGRWSVFYNVVFGFKNSEGKHRPFQSAEVTSGKKGEKRKIEVSCAATNLIKGLKEKLENAKKAGNKEEVAKLAKIVGDYPVMGVYSLNNDHYLNVVTRDGKVGQLELGHKAMLELKNEIDRVRKDDNFDPLSPDNGRFFNIRRVGKGRDTSYPTTVVKEKIELAGVGKVDKDIVHVIDDALGDRLLTRSKNGTWFYKEAANLSTLYPRPSSEEVSALVKTADLITGKSPVADEIFKSKKDAQQVSETIVNASDEDIKEAVLNLSTEQQETLKNAVDQAVVKEEAKAVSPVVQETKAAVAKAETTLASTGPNVNQMSTEEFAKLMGIEF